MEKSLNIELSKKNKGTNLQSTSKLPKDKSMNLKTENSNKKPAILIPNKKKINLLKKLDPLSLHSNTFVDRPFSENNVTHQPDELINLKPDKLMQSISNNRDINTIRRKIHQTKSINQFKIKRIISPKLNMIDEKFKKTYVAKFKDIIETKKFDNPALFEMKKSISNNEKIEVINQEKSSDSIKDEIENYTDKSNLQTKIKEFSKNSSSGSNNQSKNKQKILLHRDKSYNTSSNSNNSDEIFQNKRNLNEKRFIKNNKASSDSSSSNNFETKKNTKIENFKSEIYGIIIKWKLGDIIDCGSFSQVFRAMDCSNGKIFAVKRINLDFPWQMEEESIKEIESELEIMKKIKHPNIMQYNGHERIGENLYIYLEYISGGSITSIISKYGPLPEYTVKLYVKQLLLGLNYLHENKVIHKDIKGANILVDTNGTVKLSDFGCSKKIEKTLNSYLKDELKGPIQGSILWMAPEVINQTKYGRKSDIWSFGCTILEMITGKSPWIGCKFDNPVDAIMKIGLGNEIPFIPDYLSFKLKDFLLCCLQRDPEKRSTVKKLLEHEFIK